MSNPTRPNISTEHQNEGDARDPSETLDRNQDRDCDTIPGGLDQEEVEDRPNVGVVEPEDYPDQQ